MYCSTCGATVAQGLSYCNHCGAKAGGAKDDGAVKSSEVRPEFLVASMVRLFILGLLAIAVLVGVLKAVADFDFPILFVVTTFSFLLMLMVEGVLIGLLLGGRRRVRKAEAAERRLKEKTVRELGEAQARVLPEPLSGITEHTTRSFEPLYSERKSK
jgi:hypothetical protein